MDETPHKLNCGINGMKKDNKTKIRIRKPVARKPTMTIPSRKDKLKRKRVRFVDLMKELQGSV